MPTFVDAGSNFAGTAIEEDNLVAQLRNAGRNLVHLGDDTWHSLFPGYFDANLTHAYDSFNVWDLFTVDNGVTEHLVPLLAPDQTSKWDIIFGHYLGVDHAGHRYGPDHPATNGKLQEMDAVIRNIIDKLDQNTLLVVMGDHGMDIKGDHGGESDDEVEAALWMYSKKGIFGRGHNGELSPPRTAKERPVGQIDLVPTLSLLLGMPIPYNNLGGPIAEAFVGPGKPDWRSLATVNALAAAQINKYQKAYSQARGLTNDVFALPNQLWDSGSTLWGSLTSSSKSSDQEEAFRLFSNYQHSTLKICRGLWARFDVPSMLQGIGILLCSLAILIFFARCQPELGYASSATYLGYMSTGGIAVSFMALGTALFGSGASLLHYGLFGLAAGSILGFAIAFVRIPEMKRIPMPRSLWAWLAIFITVLQSVGFASNSYTIWEDDILLFFLVSFGILGLVSSIGLEASEERYTGIVQSVAFAILTSVASLSKLCREEQMPYCRSTYYASSTSSTSAPWQLLIPLMTATLLPVIVKLYYKQTRSYEGVATVWIGTVFRLGLLSNAIFWILDAADDNDWLEMDKGTLKTIRNVISRLVLGVSLAVGTSSWIYSKPCISIKVVQKYDEGLADPKSVQIFGSSNAHGTRYFLLVGNILIGLGLLQKPMGNGALALLTIQIIALAEILHANNLSRSSVGPIVLAALGNLHFFKTGHQATLSSIQWESAFIPLTTITYPLSPILVVLNTFGAQILTAAAVPLLCLWKRPSRRPGLLGDVTTALATFLLYHATINVATTMWAGHLRRHLMLFRIFNPRFMTAAAVLLLVDLVGALVALVAFGVNTASIAEVFGWS